MIEIDKNERRRMFTDVLQQLLAVEFPNEDDIHPKIYLVFHNEDNLKIAVYFLQHYEGIGFSLIVEKLDQSRITLKIYEPDTDDFHECKNVTVRTNVVDKYRHTYRDSVETFLSIGLMDVVEEDPKIRQVSFLQIPIKSITFYGVD